MPRKKTQKHKKHRDGGTSNVNSPIEDKNTQNTSSDIEIKNKGKTRKHIKHMTKLKITKKKNPKLHETTDEMKGKLTY